MARHRLAFYLHSRIEAFSLTHLLLGSVRFSPNKYSFYRNYLTRLLSIRVLSPFEKPQRTLTHCRPLAISPPRQPEGSCSLPTFQLVYHERWKAVSDCLILVWPNLREPTIRRGREPQNASPRCPDTSYRNQSRMTGVHTEPD